MIWDTWIPKLLNMSLTGSIVIVCVLLARAAMKKAPKAFRYALWLVVLFRLLCPVSISGPVSVLDWFDGPETEDYTVEYIPSDIAYEQTPEVALPNRQVSEMVSQSLPKAQVGDSVNPLQVWFWIGGYVWLAGMLALAGYSGVSLWKLRGRLKDARLVEEGVYISDWIDTPFVVGLVRPRIYLPSGLGEQEKQYILLHERHHIRRGDPVFKMLMFAALCVHWFNPLVWASFVLSTKDMEMSCDEAVLKKLGDEIRCDYSASLLSLATGRQILAGAPLAFGEGDTKMRIKNVLNWKKPGSWVIAVCAVVCVAVLIVCAVNPAEEIEISREELDYQTLIGEAAGQEDVLAIWYTAEDEEQEGDIMMASAKGVDLALLLGNSQWTAKEAPKQSLSSPGSVEFILGDDPDWRVTIYRKSKWAVVKYGDEKQYYKAEDGNYEAAVEMLNPPVVETAPTEATQPVQTTAPEGDQVFYQGTTEGVTLGLEVPRGWRHTAQADPETADGAVLEVSFWPEGYEDSPVQIRYYEEILGVCGTGLLIVDGNINGWNVSFGTYDDHPVWDYMTYSDFQGHLVAFTTEGVADWWQEHEEEALRILGSIEVAFVMEDQAPTE